MVTQQVLSLAETIVNKGNVFGIDRKVLQVYFGESLINDDEPSLLVDLDPYIALGGFIETFLRSLIRQELHLDERNVNLAYLNFSENIKKFESEILNSTKRYIDEANSLGNALRKLGYKLRFLISERTDGIDIYLLGRTELLRPHVSQRINTWLSEGISKILVVSPFEYAMYKNRFLPQYGVQNIQLEFLPDLFEAFKGTPAMPDMLEVALLEPYEAPVETLPLSIRETILANIDRIKVALKRIKNLTVKVDRVRDCPFSYEQVWLLNPLVSVNVAASILSDLSDLDAIITLRTSTASILRVAAEISEVDINIYDYIEVLSRAIIEGSPVE
ncbi:MAG: hypothetical protein QXY55_01740 [Candidatus Korarchaeota archaeon]|nr:hypothetical protein [Thermoproteota archaeon]